MARGLERQVLTLSLAGGLETKGDVRASDSRQLDIARDVKFSENGGVQTRLPFSGEQSDIFGGGTIANARRIEPYGDELVLFTDTQVYSWNFQLSKWVLRGTHLAVTVDERPRFATTGDQIDGDRAELNGTVVFAWTEGTQVFAAALDKTTGSTLVAPTAVSTAIGRPRLVALATKILLFVEATTTLLTVRAIDPAAPGTGIGGVGTTVLNTDFNLFYDVVRAGTQDLCVGVCRRVTTTSYTVFKVTPALAVTTSTKARTADGPLAVACIPDGTKTQVVRGNGTNVEGDLLTTATLADIFTAQALGTATVSLNQVTAEFSTVPVGGFFVATVFWSRAESATGTDGSTIRNTVDTNNTIGAATTMVLRLGLGSRAFAAQGRVFVWCVFARANEVTGLSGAVALGVRAQLQNTYFLYRDDGLLVTKAIPNAAGGYAPSTGRLPGVGATSATGLDFAWCGTSRRIIDLGGEDHTGFEARTTVDVAFAFDDDTARRAVMLGKTLYVAGGLPLQYDGVALSEIGFLIFPYNFFVTVGGAGNLTAGTYTYKNTISWPNARDERERSTTALGAEIVVPGANRVAIQLAGLHVTRKTIVPPAMEVWRGVVDAPPESPFYLTTGKDPALLAGAGVENGYIPNDAAVSVAPSTGFFVLSENFADTTLVTKETNPENGAVLESLAPPGAKIIFATDTRIFLGGLSGAPDSVAYSRLRGEGEIASFHDGNVFAVPPAGGAMTAIATINETLVVFRESAIYVFPGQGFDNLGQGFNFGPPAQLSSDVGAVSAEAVALTPMGIVFKSRKGWYLATLSGVRYIGAAVAAFDGDTVRAVHVMATEHEVRILTNNRLLAWDYQAVSDSAPMGQWAERTVNSGVHATMWQGQYVVLTPTGPRFELASYSSTDYGIDVEQAWVKPADLMGAARIFAIQALGEYRSDFVLRIRVARDYQYDGAGNVVYFDDVTWVPTPAVVGSVLQHRHVPSQGAVTAIKVRLTATHEGLRSSLATATDLSPPVQTTDAIGDPGPAWNATFRSFKIADALAAQASTDYIGDHANRLTMSLGFELGTEAIIDVRDHFLFDPATGRWREALHNVGVRVVSADDGVGDPGTVDVGALASSIGAQTKLMQIQLTDPADAVIDIASMAGQLVTGSFTGGIFGQTTGESCKLTGIAYEVGLKPGLAHRLSAGQKGATS